MSKLKDEIMKRVDELESPSDMYSPALQQTLPTLVNASRKIIYGHNMSHLVNIKNPDFPHVYTGFENVYSEYSEMLDRAENDLEIVRRFKRNKYHHLIVVYDIAKNEFDVIEREPFEQFFENYATKYNNKLIDSLDEGDIIKKGEAYKISTSFVGEDQNYALGKELNTLYMISVDTEEDCITLMNGAEKMMENYKVNDVSINIPLDSTVLCNLYGDHTKKIYKPFPEVGEKIENGILMAMRKVTSDSIFIDGKDKNTAVLNQGDIVKYVKGKVIDITCICNEDISRIPDSITYGPIKKLLKEQNKFYSELYDYLTEIYKGVEKGIYTVGRGFHYWRNKAYDFIDSSAFFAINNDPIKNIHLTFRVVDKIPLVPGSKLTGMFGNKGVVGKICSPEDSITLTNGKKIHIIVDALGVVGRINVGQLFVNMADVLSESVLMKMIEVQNNEPVDMMEQINALVAGEIVKVINSKKLTEERFKILKKFFKCMDTLDADYIEEYFDSLKPKQQETFMEKVIRNGIYIIQDPNEPSDIDHYREAYDKFYLKENRPRVYAKLPKGGLSLRSVVVGKQPFIRLKQDPIDKYSVRGKSNIDPATHLPAKSFNKKQYLEPYADTAVQFGTFETLHLLLCKYPEAVSLFYGLLSNSPDAKDMIRRLYNNEMDEDFVKEFSKVVFSSSRKNREVVEGKLYALGIKMIIELDDGSIG